jgi:hypothetical protein
VVTAIPSKARNKRQKTKLWQISLNAGGSDHWNGRLLARVASGQCCRAADQADELPPLHLRSP